MDTKKIIVVTGATGKQGGAVADHLLKAGFHVRAITRNPTSPAAAKLQQKGAGVVAADMEDKASVLKALDGAYGVFSVQNYWEKGIGYEGEIRQGRNIADAAKLANIQHFVQASIADAEKAAGVGHWECKVVLEQYIKEIGLPYTLLGETFFMENFFDPKNGPMILPFLSGFLEPGRRFHMVAVQDIGAIVSRIFQHPEQFLGRKINIASDSLTISEMRETYNRVMPKKAPGYRIPTWVSKLVNGEMAKQLRWNNNPGWKFPLEEVREIHPQLTSFEQFLKEKKIIQ